MKKTLKIIGKILYYTFGILTIFSSSNILRMLYGKRNYYRDYKNYKD